MILMEIYSTYEHKGLEAVRIGERLFREYPNNPGLQLRRNLCESGDRRL